uniref:Uncharacterized protein n=1 Tax=Cucumis sativus TaxID=3659 RepID=A0A0A0KRR3_CUCSA
MFTANYPTHISPFDYISAKVFPVEHTDPSSKCGSPIPSQLGLIDTLDARSPGSTPNCRPTRFALDAKFESKSLLTVAFQAFTATSCTRFSPTSARCFTTEVSPD